MNDFESLENHLTKEVYTDGAEFIGPKDTAQKLEAFTVSCGIILLDNRVNSTVGIIHLSLGGKIEEVVGESISKAKQQGLELTDFTLRRFNGDETIWSEAAQALNNFGIKLPPWEWSIEPGIRIDKQTGEVEFYV